MSIWVELKIEHEGLLLGCIYRPGIVGIPDNTRLTELIHKVSQEKGNVIILGDFNYREINWTTLTLNENNIEARDFLNTYTESNFKQLVNFPTRIRKEQKSLLDLLLTNDKKLVTSLKSNPPIGLSDHVVLTATIQLNVRPYYSYMVEKRNFWKADYAVINNDIIQLSDQTNITDRLTYNTFLDCVRMVIDKHIPLTIVKKNSQKPWINLTHFREIEKKRKLWDKYRSTKSDDDYETYRKQNNKLRKMLIESRKAYENNLLECGDKKFYSYIKRTLNSKSTQITLRNPVSNTLISDPIEIAEIFSRQFKQQRNAADEKKQRQHIREKSMQELCNTLLRLSESLDKFSSSIDRFSNSVDKLAEGQKKV
nr:unnamed protein product [Callosobruchus analis]